MTFDFKEIRFTGVDGQPMTADGTDLIIAKQLYSVASTLVTNQFLINLYKAAPFEMTKEEVQEVIPFIENNISTYYVRSAMVDYLKSLK